MVGLLLFHRALCLLLEACFCLTQPAADVPDGFLEDFLAFLPPGPLAFEFIEATLQQLIALLAVASSFVELV